MLRTSIGLRVFFPSLCLMFLTLSGMAQQEEVIYHVVQRSFYDSNGDRHGDLNGLRNKLPYLQELGVTSILMLPLYRSVYYHNYFAEDFETIDPEFGTMDDYLSLVREIHRLGMKVYMDMETQYVTEDHLWYRDSYKNPKSQYSDYLVYNGPGNTEPENIIFNLDGLEGYDGTYKKITTVNLNSPAVLQYNIDLFRHWTDPNGDGNFEDGVDGFRLDHMMDDLDNKGKFTDLFEKFWTPLIAAVKAVNPNIVFIAEQADWSDSGKDYLTRGHVDKVFAFNLMTAIASFDAGNIQGAAGKSFAVCEQQRQQIVFLENHDTDRFASLVASDPGKLRAGAAMNLLIGGTPLIYYGQELGMQGKGGFGMFGNTDGNDIPRREAFEWDPVSDAQGMATWYQDSGPWWDQTNLKDRDGLSLHEERDNPASLYTTYRRLLALRKKYPALIDGKSASISGKNGSVLTFSRINADQSLIVMINLTGEEQETELSLNQVSPDLTAARVVHGGGLARLEDGVFTLSLPAYEAVVVLLR